MVKGLFCQLVHYLITLNVTMAWHRAEAQCPEEVHMSNQGFEHLRPQLPASKTSSPSRIQHRVYRIHVPIIVQWHGNGCSLSSKDGSVIRESFGQLTTGRLTMLEMAVDDRRCPHPIVNVCVFGWLLIKMWQVLLCKFFFFKSNLEFVTWYIPGYSWLNKQKDRVVHMGSKLLDTTNKAKHKTTLVWFFLKTF